MSASGPVEFPRFRQDHDEYDKAQAAWSEVFRHAIGSDYLARWTGWLLDPFLEGSPIFSRINRANHRGIVINQILPEEDDLRFRAYLDEFATDSPEEVGYLAITCPLTDAAKDKAKKLIYEYGRQGAARDEMERFCQEATE